MKVKCTYLVSRQQARGRDTERHRGPQGGEGDDDADDGRGASGRADQAAAADEAGPPRDAAQQTGLCHRVLRGHAAQEAVPVLHAQRSLVPERHGSEEQGGEAQERDAGGEAGEFGAAVPPRSPGGETHQQLLWDTKNELLQEGKDGGSDQYFSLLCSQSQKLWERREEVENGSGFHG